MRMRGIIIIIYYCLLFKRQGVTESSPELADVVYQFPAQQQSRLMQVSSGCISSQPSSSPGSCRSAHVVSVPCSAAVQAHAGQLRVYQFPAQQQSRLMQVSVRTKPNQRTRK